MMDNIIEVPQADERIRIFRRKLVAPAEFAGLEVDASIIVSNRYIVLCDTLLCPEDMAEIMHRVRGELAGRQLLIVNSHADWDHTWGNSYFTKNHEAAPIIAHELCLKRMQSEEARQQVTDYQAKHPIFQNVVLTPPTITFSETLTLHGGDLTIKLLAAPGHCPDAIAAWLPELCLLLAFDAVEMPLPVIDDAAGVQPMLATLERFQAMHPLEVLCSHGRVTGPAMIEKNLAYLREIERRCRGFLEQRRPTNDELEHMAMLLHYPLATVLEEVAMSADTIDRPFYEQVHEQNIQYIMQDLMG